MNVSSEWYYVDGNNEQQGPVDVPTIKTLLANGGVGMSTLFWSDGQPDWKSLNDLPALKSKVVVQPSARGPPPAPSAAARTTQDSSSFGYGSAPQPNMNRRPTSTRQQPVAQARREGSTWVEKLTVDGMPYYYDSTADAVSWDKPDSLKTAAELETASGDWVWVTDGDNGWVAARLLSKSSASAQVQLQNGSRKTVETRQEPLWPLTLSSLTRLEDDLVMLDALNQGLMMHCLKERYNQDQIYTWVGANHSVLVSVNPFRQLPIYTVNVMREFSKSSVNRLEPPHSFAIAHNAFMKLRLEGVNQAILISGESGAGKTEATKQCLNFLAEVAGSVSNVEQKILNANPVLEAFGNAKTLRNNNSSRFGKWMEIHFDSRGSIIGARIENYLLEKSRVTFQARGERNYHVFYQLCFSDISSQLQLGQPETFRYLNQSGCTTVPGIDDLADLRDVKAGFANLNFAEDEVMWMFQLVAGVLNLGNITFATDGDQGSVVDRAGSQWLQKAARLLYVNPNELTQGLITRSIEVRGDTTRILLKPQEAAEAADALAKAAYGKMFDWLVQRINSSVQGARGSFIGVLDIFGFEIFQKNSFEQLCINFTNEKLQQHFNKHTFKEEEQCYMSEGIPFVRVPFIDNQPVLDLFEGRTPIGIMHLLDEEVRLPKSGDDKWLSKCDNAHAAHPNWNNNVGQRAGTPPSSFFVQHYAGLVTYDCRGFVEKNRDSLFRDLYDLMSGSTHRLTRENFPAKDKNPRRLTTLGGEFRKQLTDLMVVVDSCTPHYIRCIKPNDEKKPSLFKTKMCIEQLTYAGVFEAMQIRKSGYPFRLTHRRFVARYRPLTRKEHGWIRLNANPRDDRAMCRAILECVNQDFSQVQIGNTMVLYRAEEHRILELLRNLSLERVLPVAQRAGRRKNGRKLRKAIARARPICERAIRVGNDVNLLEQAIEQASGIMSPFVPVFHWTLPALVRAKDLRFKLEERVKLTALYRQLVRKNADQCFPEFVDAIVRADKITDLPGTSEEMRLEQQVRDMLYSVAGARIDPWAAEANYLLDKAQMAEVVKEAARFAYNTSELQDIRDKLALPEQEFVKLQLRRANEMNDPDRIINREIRLKELYLQSYGASFAFNRCPVLRDPVLWANSKFLTFNRDELIAGFLRHTTVPIHESLTQLDAKLSKEALKTFKSVMGWMGDRKYQYPDTLAQEVLSTGLQMFGLRTEIYAQVIKQLSNNPSAESLSRGWDLLALMLSCFPPPENFENFLAQFLRASAPADKRDQFTLAMHMIIYGGARTNPPSINEISIIISDFFRRPVNGRFAAEDIISSHAVLESKTMERAPDAASPDIAADVTSTTTTRAAPTAAVAASPGLPAPAPPPPKARANTAVALYDFVAGDQEGMLDLRKGDVVTLLNTEDADWWMGRVGSREGWIPANYVKM